MRRAYLLRLATRPMRVRIDIRRSSVAAAMRIGIKRRAENARRTLGAANAVRIMHGARAITFRGLAIVR
jgi:hypothetical protein